MLSRITVYFAAVTFAPTSDLLGNTVPSGAVSNIFPTLVPGAGKKNVSFFKGYSSLYLLLQLNFYFSLALFLQ